MAYGRRFDDEKRFPGTTGERPAQAPERPVSMATGRGEPERVGRIETEGRADFGRDGPSPDERRRTRRVIAGGSIGEAVCGAAVVIMTILGLGGVGMPGMAFAATILLGAALILQSGAFVARYDELTAELRGEDEQSEISGGVSAELIAGIAGVILGLLAVVGVAPGVLIPVAVIVFGGALLLGGGMTRRIAEIAGDARDRRSRSLRQAAEASAGAELLIGLAAIVLGILALFDIAVRVLSLVALLGLGVAVLVAGGALGGQALQAARTGRMRPST